MKKLRELNFITKDELTAVTGLLEGGRSGKLINKDGSTKYTNVLSNKELFHKQLTPYVYPLFKAHKMPKKDLINIKPDEVHKLLPARLVVGMSSCQLSRAQIWLESFLSPLARQYGSFEYLKDSNDYLLCIEDTKTIAKAQQWDWEKHILFTIDVKALYPSVKFVHLKKALMHTFSKCTGWPSEVKDTLVELILYTLENQQICWDSKFYLLCQGLPTGAKHSVPLANIFLSFIMFEALDDPTLNNTFNTKVKLWKRFIDDGTGIFEGDITEFYDFFKLLETTFRKYDLELTCETDTHIISDSGYCPKNETFIAFLDVELFRVDNSIHTREHRKETAAKNFVSNRSAHPSYTFKGIVKSQLIRLRRICSRDNDFKSAVAQLKHRCLNSGYCPQMVSGLLNNGLQMKRVLQTIQPIVDSSQSGLHVRLVSLCGTVYEKEFNAFARRMNTLLSSSCLVIDIVKSTYLTLAQLLFNNNDSEHVNRTCSNEKCLVCVNNIRSSANLVTSTVNGCSYPIDENINCDSGGIYMVKGACNAQYTGKTVDFANRFQEHFLKCKSSSVYCHKKQCPTCRTVTDFEVTLIENYQKRGKYTLSEREFLWNQRIKGTINVLKTLKS